MLRLNVKVKLESRTDPVPARGNEPWPPPDLGGNYGQFFFLSFCASACIGGALVKMFMGPSKGEMLVKFSVGLVSHTAVDWPRRLPPPRGVPPPEM